MFAIERDYRSYLVLGSIFGASVGDQHPPGRFPHQCQVVGIDTELAAIFLDKTDGLLDVIGSGRVGVLRSKPIVDRDDRNTVGKDQVANFAKTGTDV